MHKGTRLECTVQMKYLSKRERKEKRENEKKRVKIESFECRRKGRVT